ncbi:hypothetical protein C942_02259 [Photobacterium marinum]|uniref:Uncharacterized protein n=1 Tax=Photobacterium marinum TaxID=1056511 RepID=L8J907_9GAMM|nr:hypothetical protein C942_02259 [Photobacterium marinum]
MGLDTVFLIIFMFLASGVDVRGEWFGYRLLKERRATG